MNTPLSDEIRALTAFANETTGKGDTLLGDAVKTLCDGYGKGGGGGEDEDEAMPLISEKTVSASSYATYDTLTSFLTAYSSEIVRGDGYFYAIVFKDNTSNARAGKRAVIWSRNSYDCLINERVGYSGSDLSYGVDVYAGCTIIIRKYQIDLEVITRETPFV